MLLVPNQSLAAIRNKRRIIMALQALEIIKSPKVSAMLAERTWFIF